MCTALLLPYSKESVDVFLSISFLCAVLEVRSWGAASWHCEPTCQVHKEKAVFYACLVPKGCETSYC